MKQGSTIRYTVLICLLNIGLQSCGGDDSTQQQVASKTPTHKLQAEEQITSQQESGGQPSTNITPSPSSTPSSTPSATPLPPSRNEVNMSVSEISKPNFTAEIGSTGIDLAWQSNASSYRVLYYLNKEKPHVIHTENQQAFVPYCGDGTYRIIVEAYDALGNSKFSDVYTAEIIR